MSIDDAAIVSQWRYPDRWSVYDLESAEAVLDDLDLYRAVCDGDGTLVGFFCVGAAARVPGLDPDPQMIDVGVGLDPHLVGRGRGQSFGTAVLDHLAGRCPGQPLRAVIQAWNTRSRRLAGALGFIDVGELSTPVGEPRTIYRVLLRPGNDASRDFVVTQCGVWMFGDRLMLRDFEAADEHAVHSYASDPLVTRFMDWGPNSIADTRAFLADALEERHSPARANFNLAVIVTASDTLIGSGSMSVTSARQRHGELGYVFNRDFWSQGYATEAARLLVRFGFEYLGLRRIRATCRPENHASARVLQKAGLRYEGLVRNGAGRDSSLFAIVDDGSMIV